MSFVEKYLNRYVRFPSFIKEECKKADIIVVIPCFKEVYLSDTIDSLLQCRKPKGNVEVIVVINEPDNVTTEAHNQNVRTAESIIIWKKQHPDAFFKLFAICPQPFPKKHAGAGLARKTGMDEAVRRFGQADNSDGIIISLDADTLVAPNYFTETENLFHNNSHYVGTTIAFHHRINELSDENQRQGILFYEKYLTYYKNAMAYAGYPNAIYTIGSAFAVKVYAYIKQGGMNNRQAGEDFYFLHKLAQFGPLAELNTTCVFPSARVSDRVPFGTGFAMKKWQSGDYNLLNTYNFCAFRDLKDFFSLIPDFYKIKSPDPENMGVAKSLCSFLDKEKFYESLEEIKKNISTPFAFQKRFFRFFNAFRILKFLNFSHETYYDFQSLEDAIKEEQRTHNDE